MFGYIQANLDDLSENEKKRYRSAYCGLCQALGEQHGCSARLGLSYDLTFLAILFSSLYEPEEQVKEKRCMIHPTKKGERVLTPYTEYAADMTVALSYYKALDDWNDEHKVTRKMYSSALKSKYEAVRKKHPEQCATIERELSILSEIEKNNSPNPDEGANAFGRLMAAIFVPVNDNWEPYLRNIGFGLGRFIYIADAAVDYEEDIKKKNYNPLVAISKKPEEVKPILKQMLGEVSEAFEFLPLVQDAHLLRNILYSGIWQKYNYEMQRQKKEVTDD